MEIIIKKHPDFKEHVNIFVEKLLNNDELYVCVVERCKRGSGFKLNRNLKPTKVILNSIAVKKDVLIEKFHTLSLGYILGENKIQFLTNKKKEIYYYSNANYGNDLRMFTTEQEAIDAYNNDINGVIDIYKEIISKLELNLIKQ